MPVAKSLSQFFVQCDKRESLAWITLNRPGHINAVNPALTYELEQVVIDCLDDPHVSGLILTGADNNFVGGADVSFFQRNVAAGDLDRIEEFVRNIKRLFSRLQQSHKPVVARVDGAALGGGLELGLACHAIVASTRVTIALPETGLGICPGAGGTQRTPRRIGVGLAKWMVFTGHMLGGPAAREIGLVDYVVPPDQLDAAVVQCVESGAVRPARPALREDSLVLESFFARHRVDDIYFGRVPEAATDNRLKRAAAKVASRSLTALRVAERLIEEGIKTSLDAGLNLELAAFREVFTTEDARIGLAAFGNSTPKFVGR